MYSSRLLEVQPEKEKETDMEHALDNSSYCHSVAISTHRQTHGRISLPLE